MSVDSPQGGPVQPAKKGMGVWGWVAIGCGIVVLLGLVTCGGLAWFGIHKGKQYAQQLQDNPAKFIAEKVVAANPDLEMVSSDDKQMTVRDKKTGEEVTMNFEDIKNGKMSFKTKEGETTFDASAAKNGEGGSLTVTGPSGQTATFGAGAGSGSAPSWLPIYTGATVSGNYDATTPEGHAGAITVTTSDSVEQVMAFYESKLKEAGFKVQKMTMSGDQGSGGTVSAESDKRTVGVALSTADGKTQALVTFNEKK